MGIRGLTSLIKKNVPEALNGRTFQYFNGSRIAIDTSILLYKFRYSNSNENAHIIGFLNKCMNYIKHGIIPIFIIDGKPPPEKSETIQKRYRNRQKLEDRIRELKMKLQKDNVECVEDIMSKITKLDKQIIRVKKEHHEETSQLLKILGFQVIQSPGEAEEICAYLQKNKIVHFTYSDDTDVLPLGCQIVLRSNGKNNYFTEIDLEKVLLGLNLTFDQFIDLCILCGCDYCPSIPRVNHQKAYELIKEYKTIEEVIKNFREIPEEFNYQKARDIFRNDVNFNNFNFSCLDDSPCIDELRFYQFLTKRRFSKRYISRYIRKFKQALDTNLSNTAERNSDNSGTHFFKKTN